jgi:hypothetical protein
MKKRWTEPRFTKPKHDKCEEYGHEHPQPSNMAENLVIAGIIGGLVFTILAGLKLAFN